MKKFTVLLSVLVASLLVVMPTLADDAKEGRVGRAEVRFMEGMIDHHQMALDMAQDCLAKAVTDSVRTLCQAVIDAQTPEIELMQGWLLDWYNIDYAPMSMADMDMMMGMMDMSMADMMAMMEDMTMRDMMDMMHGGGMRGQHGQQNQQGQHNQHGQQNQQGQHNQHGQQNQQGQHNQHNQQNQQGQHNQHGQQNQQGMGEGPFTDPAMMMGMFAGLSRLEGVEYEIAWLEAMIDHHDDALHMSGRILLRAEHAALRTLAEAIIEAQTAEIEQMEALIETLSS